MSETRMKFMAIYLIAVFSAYLLKKGICRTADTAIEKKKLSTGVYSLFHVEGEIAVKLAKGYIRGVNIYFWFIVLCFPLGFLLALYYGAI